MSKRKLNIEDNNYHYYIKELPIIESDNINIYSQILSNKSSFYITNQNHSNYIEIKPLSIKSILLKSQLDPYENILFSFYKDTIPPQFNNMEKPKNKHKNENTHKTKLRGAKKNIHKKEGDKSNNEDIILNVSSPDRLIKGDENQNDSINNIYLNNYNNKNENNYDSELDLLSIKTNENLIKMDNMQNQNLLLLCYIIKINNKNLKCFYLSLFICGLIYGIIFLDALIDKNKTIECLFNIFCFPLSILLIITGLYGYFKVNEKIYDDKLCITMTYFCVISPFLSLIFSMISLEENVRKNIIMNSIINIIAIILASICAYILKGLKNNKKKNGLLFEKISIV